MLIGQYRLIEIIPSIEARCSRFGNILLFYCLFSLGKIIFYWNNFLNSSELNNKGLRKFPTKVLNIKKENKNMRTVLSNLKVPLQFEILLLLQMSSWNRFFFINKFKLKDSTHPRRYRGLRIFCEIPAIFPNLSQLGFSKVFLLQLLEKVLLRLYLTFGFLKR